MKKILQRYLAVKFIVPFWIGTALFVSFLLVFQLFKVIKIFIKKGVSLWEVGEMIGHIALSFVPMAVPLAGLFAAVYTMNRLSEDSELVAIRSFGMKKNEILLPFVIVSIFLALSVHGLNQEIIPWSKTRFKNGIAAMSAKGLTSDLKSEHFFVEIPDITLFAREVGPDGKILKDVFLNFSKEGSERTIVSSRGELFRELKNGLPQIKLSLEKGNILKRTANKNDLEKIVFERYILPIVEESSFQGMVSKENMKSSSELAASMRELTEQIKEKMNLILKIEEGSSGNNENKEDLKIRLSSEILELKLGHSRANLEYWMRLNTPFQVLIFIFLGLCLGVKAGRGKTSNVSLPLALTVISYYVLFFTGVGLAKKGDLPPSSVVLVPSLLLLILAQHYYRRLDWQT